MSDRQRMDEIASCVSGATRPALMRCVCPLTRYQAPCASGCYQIHNVRVTRLDYVSRLGARYILTPHLRCHHPARGRISVLLVGSATPTAESSISLTANLSAPPARKRREEGLAWRELHAGGQLAAPADQAGDVRHRSGRCGPKKKEKIWPVRTPDAVTFCYTSLFFS